MPKELKPAQGQSYTIYTKDILSATIAQALIEEDDGFCSIHDPDEWDGTVEFVTAALVVGEYPEIVSAYQEAGIEVDNIPSTIPG